MSPLISVIIPVYKVEAYLTACVESVLAQTYQNVEIILVDDGSPDSCPRMCDEFAARDSRIRVIHKENGGLSSARNAGIDAAKGEYLAFLDSDDLWTPLFLERLYRAICETDADLAVCLFLRFRGDPPTELPETAQTLTLTQRDAFECLFGVRNENMVVAPNKLYDRKLFTPVNESIVVAWNKLYPADSFREVRYPVGKLHEDEAVIHELLGLTQKIAWVEEAHYLYREAADSITTAKFNIRRLDEMYAKERRIAWFESHGMPDLADQTRLAYLSGLMRLYRTVQAELEDRAAAKEACQKIYDRFCALCTPELIQGRSRREKLRYTLFRAVPAWFSRLDYIRLKRKGIT